MSEQQAETVYELHYAPADDLSGDPDWIRYATAHSEQAARAAVGELEAAGPGWRWRIVRVDTIRTLVLDSRSGHPELVAVPPEVHFVRDGTFLHAVPLGLRYAYGTEDRAEVTCSTCREIIEGLTDRVE